jgi:hypothetical protein
VSGKPVRKFLKRWSRPAAILIGAAVLSSIIISFTGNRRRMRELTAGIAGTPTWGTIMAIDRSSGMPRWNGGRPAIAVYRTIPSDSTKALMIVWDPSAKPSQAAMQIQLMGYAATGGGAQVPSWGNPAISCDLNPMQASSVLEHDVPDALIEAMLLQARRSKWVPMPGGGIVNCVEVDPGEYFPR